MGNRGLISDLSRKLERLLEQDSSTLVVVLGLPLDQAAYERYLVEARARLGEAAFAAAWAEGRAMTLEEAVEDALDKRE